MPTLRKILLEEGKVSALPEGYSTTLPDIELIDYETDRRRKISSIQEVEVGWQVLLTSGFQFHRTSKIREIVSKEEGKVVFKTQTSVYELTS